jgi:hypothetical protein
VAPARQLLHLPQRPLWICRIDAQPWPCADARLCLLRQYREDSVAISIYLCTALHELIADLYRLNPDTAPEPRALFERILGWLPPRHLI